MKKVRLIIISFLSVCAVSMVHAKGSLEGFIKGLNAVNEALQKQTTKTVVGYDTVYQVNQKKVLVNTEFFENFKYCNNPKQIVLYSKISFSGDPRQVIEVKIPNQEESPTQTKKVIGVSYWLSPDQSTKTYMTNALRKTLSLGATVAISSQTGGIAANYASNIADAASEVVFPNMSENVLYKIEKDKFKAHEFISKGGSYGLNNVKFDNGIEQITNNESCLYFCFANDNSTTQITVYFQYAFIYEIDTYEIQEEKEIKSINPIYQ